MPERRPRRVDPGCWPCSRSAPAPASCAGRQRLLQCLDQRRLVRPVLQRLRDGLLVRLRRLEARGRSISTSWIRVGELTTAGTQVVVLSMMASACVGRHRRRRGASVCVVSGPRGCGQRGRRADTRDDERPRPRRQASRARDASRAPTGLRCHRSSSALAQLDPCAHLPPAGA